MEPESWKHRKGFMQEMAQHWALGTGRIQRLAGEGSNLGVAAPRAASVVLEEAGGQQLWPACWWLHRKRVGAGEEQILHNPSQDYKHHSSPSPSGQSTEGAGSARIGFLPAT